MKVQYIDFDSEKAMKLTDGMYTIIEKNNELCSIELCNQEHPVFQAHFPKHPILPGFIQIDIAEELLQISFKKLKKIKFVKPVLPLSKLDYQFLQNKVIIFNEKSKVSEFTYE